MSASTCWSCHSLLRQRLRIRVSYLQHLRRPKSTSRNPPSLSWYKDTTAPTSAQLQAAEKFFLTHKPRKLWTANEWRKQNDAANTSLGLIPEVAFLGRSNVGKSSLLNALLLSPGLNYVGPRPGKTKTMHAWALSPTDPKTGGAIKGTKGDMETKCAVLDMPGYGHASHNTWGDEILKYLRNRKQLKRVFVLVDQRHGLKSGDITMLRLLRKQGISTQIVASKCDKMKEGPGTPMMQGLWNQTQSEVSGPGLDILGEVLAIGNVGDGRKNDSVHYKNMRGVDEVQWAILRATGLETYAMNKAFPEMKPKTPGPLEREPQSPSPLSIPDYRYNPLTESYFLPGAPRHKLHKLQTPPPTRLPNYSYNPLTKSYSVSGAPERGITPPPSTQVNAYNPLTKSASTQERPERELEIPPPSKVSDFSFNPPTESYSIKGAPGRKTTSPITSPSPRVNTYNPLTKSYSLVGAPEDEPRVTPPSSIPPYSYNPLAESYTDNLGPKIPPASALSSQDGFPLGIPEQTYNPLTQSYTEVSWPTRPGHVVLSTPEASRTLPKGVDPLKSPVIKLVPSHEAPAPASKPKPSLATIGRGIEDLMAMVEAAPEQDAAAASPPPRARTRTRTDSHTKRRTTTVKGRTVVEYVEEVELPEQPEDVQQPSTAQTEEEWRAVGGIADLEAMMKRTLGSADNGGGRKRKKRKHS